MIETRRLKNVVIFIQTVLSFVLSRKIINIYNVIARKYGNVTAVKDFRKHFVKIVTSLVRVLLRIALCLCIYFALTKNVIILNLFKIDIFNFTMYILMILTYI